MPRISILLGLLLATCAFVVATPDATAAKRTVCTITVNSADERNAFRRYLPESQYEFVELVERGRPDWLASACRQDIRCDALIISGHFDGGDQFYTDRLDAREFLPVAELERASCSDSCPGVFSQLKEVYLFGCNTLNAEAMRSASAEIARSLVRSGQSPADAERLARLLSERHGESNRERMRHIFKGVPVLYGFSSKAPLGRTAGPLLERYFQSTPSTEIATGRVSGKLVGLFAPTSMTVASGLTDFDPHAGFRTDVCHFSDDRLSDAKKLAFVHDLLRRDTAEVRMFLDHLERYAGSLSVEARHTPETAAAIDAIAHDESARGRYLEFVRDADQPAVQARMIDLAESLGWLTPRQAHAEFLTMIADRMTRNAIGSAEVDLVCSRASERGASNAGQQLPAAAPRRGNVAHAAVLACLGNDERRADVLRALTSGNDDDVAIAQVYLRHRPIAGVDEQRQLAAAVARMPPSDAQVRAIDTLARLRIADPESLVELARLYRQARSVATQRAIAGVLIRADYPQPERADLARSLRVHRVKSPDSDDVIDALLRRLQAAQAP